MSFIVVSEASVRLGRHQSLRVGSLTLRPGERWAVFGGNGAGKTQLSRLIAGRLRQSSLYVSYPPEFDSRRDVHWVSFEEQQRLWSLDQRRDISEYSERSEDQGTTVSALIQGGRVAANQDAVLLESLLRGLQLEQQAEQGIRFLSSGQTRRALIARALYASHGSTPQLLIFDDPLETLDAASRTDIVGLIESHLGPHSIVLQLCRRAQDLFPFVRDVALMQGCRLLSAAPLGESMAAIDELDRQGPALVGDLPRLAQAKAPLASLIRLQDVSARYGDNWLFSGLDWELRPGEHTLIAGPNGCGKSTLLGLIDGENHKAYGQQVELFGRRRGSGESVWDIKSQFGCVSNELHNRYVKGWRVLEVLLSGYFDSVGLYDDCSPGQKAHAQHWLHYLGLGDTGKSYYHELSFGQQRLLLLARAMLKEPAILVLDEPCVGLDNGHRRAALQVLEQVAQHTATTLVYVSHVADEAPACIRRRLLFGTHGDGSETVPRYQVRQTLAD